MYYKAEAKVDIFSLLQRSSTLHIDQDGFSSLKVFILFPIVLVSQNNHFLFYEAIIQALLPKKTLQIYITLIHHFKPPKTLNM